MAHFTQRRNTMTTSNVPSFSLIHKRRAHSITMIPHITSAIYPRKTPLTLSDLPTEILDQIISYYLASSTNNTVFISRSKPSTPITSTDLATGDVRRKWTASSYPLNLLLINRRLSEVAFAQIWRETAFILSLSSTDALCFLKYALSPRQRAALRRIRLTRFMLSADAGVGDDIWLSGRRVGPLFLSDSEQETVAAQEKRVEERRVDSLVKHLQARHPVVPWIC